MGEVYLGLRDGGIHNGLQLGVALGLLGAGGNRHRLLIEIVVIIIVVIVFAIVGIGGVLLPGGDGGIEHLVEVWIISQSLAVLGRLHQIIPSLLAKGLLGAGGRGFFCGAPGGRLHG